MDQTISLMAPAQAQIRPKAFAMSMNKDALTGTNLAVSTRSMALVWMLDVQRQELIACFRLKKGTAGRRYQSPSVEGRVGPKALPTTGLHAGEVSFGMTSMRLLSKGTFGLEMHLIP
jgi:hypothetical protein